MVSKLSVIPAYVVECSSFVGVISGAGEREGSLSVRESFGRTVLVFEYVTEIDVSVHLPGLVAEFFEEVQRLQ
jgi:hypothetical protein